MKTNRTREITLALAAVLGLAIPADAALVHRYSFNDNPGVTVVKDSVGTADGVIKGNGADYDGAGQLALPGGGSSTDPAESIAGYVDLPNHIINVLPSVTIEAWVTWQTSGSAWQRIFDLGTSAGGEDVANGNGNYLFLSPQGDANLRFAVRDPVTGSEFTQLTSTTPLEMGTEVCVTAVYDPAANTARLYSNAVLVASGPAPVALRDINDVNNWLGRSQWPDAMFVGSYNEFRIHNTALDSVQVAASYVSGANTPSTDPAKLGALQAVNLAVARTSMVELDTQVPGKTADYASLAGIDLGGVAGATLSSDNEAVVTVNAAGLVTAVKAGTAKLTLAYSGKTDSETITVLPRQTGIAVAGTLVVDLQAADARADVNVWPNRAKTGDFNAVGTPTYVADVNGTGIAGIQFNPVAPATDAYEGPAAPAEITGGSDCSIEVWAYNPVIADEETLVAWGRRGGPDGTNRSFNYGAHATWGAVGHWGSPDMGWSGPAPAAGTWHYLAYTYDGVNTAKVFADGLLKTTETMTLNTHADFPIRIAAQANTSGTDFDLGQALSGTIAMVRVHSGRLTDADVANNFLFGPTLKPPGQLQSVKVAVTRPTLAGVRDIGQASVIADFAELKNVNVSGFSTLESSDSSVVSVDAAGVYTAVKVGTAELRADYKGVKATATINVVAPPALALKHRYSFGEAPGSKTVSDSKGGANGVVKGIGADFDGAGQLVLPGGTASTEPAETIAGYVDLPNHIINVLANVSFEAWVTWDATASAWQRIFDLGTSAGGEDLSAGNGNYLFLSPQGDANLRFAARDPRTGTEPTQLTASAPLPQGQPVYIAVTYDYNGNSARLYRDGVQVQSGPAAVPLHLINDVNNWLGRAQWGDPMFQGKFNEFRIWEGALSADQVAANFAAGPNTVPEPPVQDVRLAIARSGAGVVVSWPSNAAGYVLKSTASLSAPIAWSTVDTSGAVDEGGTRKLTLPIGSAAQYYVLQK
jgi:hypothetical protein